MPLAARCRESACRMLMKNSFRQLQPYAALYEGNGGVHARRLAFSSRGLLAVRGSRVDIWDLTALSEPVCSFPVAFGSSRPVWSPDGLIAIAGVTNESFAPSSSGVTIWSIGTREIVMQFGQEEHERLTAIAWSPDGKFLATCSRHSVLGVWDAATGHLLWTAQTSSEPSLLAWSPDSGYLAANTFASWMVTLWRVKTQRIATTLDDDTHVIYKALDATFSPDGTHLALGTDDGRVKVWSLGVGGGPSTLVHTFSYHMDRIAGLSWSPDGKYLFSGSRDHHAVLWKSLTGDILYHTGSRGSENCIEDIAWAPDDSCLALCDSRGTVRLFRPPDLD